jgi:LysM repeat protein
VSFISRRSLSWGTLRMKIRTLISLALVIVFTAACRLKPIEEAAVITEAPILTQAATIANTAVPTNTPQPTFTAQPTNRPVSTSAAPSCVPTHAEWPSYTIRAGDTLGSIASRSGTTVDTLVTTNCIANPNVITVGTSLRVPRIPSTPTPTAAGIPVIDIGSPANVCRVVPRGIQASVWGPGDGMSSPVAYVKSALLVSVADNAYVVDIPNQNYDGWVSMSEASLTGSNCPTPQTQLQVVGGQGVVPIDGCWLVKGNTSETIYIYYQATETNAPIAIMGTFLPYRGAAGPGFQVDIPEFGHIGYIAPNTSLSLQGSNCNQPRPAQQCLLTENGLGMPVISPSSVRSATCVGLQAGIVTISWPEAPTNATQVEFWRMNANGMTDVIGVDNNLADGASIQFEVYDSMSVSVIYAIPYVTGGAQWSGQISVYIGQ